MAEPIDVAVDALVLLEWGGALRQTESGWAADFRCAVAPYSEGHRVLGREFEQLQLLGLVTEYSATVEYPGSEAPATKDVGTAQLQWVGQTHAVAAAEWVGKRFVAGEAA